MAGMRDAAFANIISAIRGKDADRVMDIFLSVRLPVFACAKCVGV
jgi:hypothetical protein